MGLVPGLRRSPGVGNGNPLQYSCLGNPMDRGSWWATALGVPKGSATLIPSHIHKHTHIQHTHLPVHTPRTQPHTHCIKHHNPPTPSIHTPHCTRAHAHTHTHTHGKTAQGGKSVWEIMRPKATGGGAGGETRVVTSYDYIMCITTLSDSCSRSPVRK